MKILHSSQKGSCFKLLVEHEDDLWHLSHLTLPGDRVTAFTERRDQGQDDKIRATREKKKKMNLTVRVESVEFHDFATRLRISGIIEEGPLDLGSHHTLNIEERGDLTLCKKYWGAGHRKLLAAAQQDAGRASLVFVSLDMDEAVVAQSRYYGVQELASISSGRSGKQFTGKGGLEGFFKELVQVLGTVQNCQRIIILGPGFTKEHFAAYLKEQESEIFKRSAVLSSGQSGMAGIHEVLKKGSALALTKETRLQFEVGRLEVFLAELGKNSGLAAYGFTELKKTANMGAVEELLVSHRLLRLGGKGEKLEGAPSKKELDNLMEKIEIQGGKIHIIGGAHDAGRQLLALGGLAGILRFPLTH